jgi:hypothetical protein
MGGFTRLLHTGQPDDLMDEIPTWVAQPLPAEHPDHGYIVLNRPYALMQWVAKAAIPEKYVLMSEPDHVWLKPMPNLMRGSHPAAFPFFYIEPSKKEYLPIVQKFVGPVSRKQTEEIAPIGGARGGRAVAGPIGGGSPLLLPPCPLCLLCLLLCLLRLACAARNGI